MSLKKKAVSGVKWTTLSSVIAASTQLIQLIVLSRLLQRRDFGIMALALFVVNISQIFIDMGVSNAIIHRQDVSREKLSSLYWMNVFLGGVIFVILVAVSPLVGNIYHEAQLPGVIVWTGITFLIQPFGQQYQVLLQKELRFKAIAVRDILSKFAGLVVGVVLALRGAGVFSLVFANVASATVATLLLIYAGRKFHKPQFRFRLQEIKEFLHFGMFQMGDRVINYTNMQVDALIIGKLLGVETLGLYNVAKDLVNRPTQIINPIITKVSFPVMAKLQDDIGKLKQIYLKTLNYLSSVNFFIYIFAALFAEPVIDILFGVKWHDAAPLLRILCFYAMIRSTGNPIGSLLLARGRADLGFYWNLGVLFVIPLTVYAGSFFGITGVAYALVFLQVILFIPGWKLMVNNLCGAHLGEYTGSMLFPLLNALLAALVSALVLLAFHNDYWIIITGGIVMGLCYLGLSYYNNRVFLTDLVSTLKK